MFLKLRFCDNFIVLQNLLITSRFWCTTLSYPNVCEHGHRIALACEHCHVSRDINYIKLVHYCPIWLVHCHVWHVSCTCAPSVLLTIVH